MADIISEVDDGFSRTAKDLFSGACGGVAQVLIGQPFDIVKVRLQTSTAYTSAADAALKIYSTEGPLAFYKGTLTPLIGIGACVSIQFGAFNFAKRYFETKNAASISNLLPTTAIPQNLSYTQYYASGAFAGLTNTILSAPIEHVRIRLQTQPHDPTKKLYAGPLDCVRKLTSQAGIGHGLYRGSAVTLLREAQAYGVWFLAFEWMMNADVRRNGVARKDMPSWKIAFYGGLAGEALWLGSYPFDIVKSKMQSDGFGEAQKYKTMRDCVGQVWKAEGVRGFWKGIGPTLLRAMPVSAGTFFVAEMTMRAIT